MYSLEFHHNDQELFQDSKPIKILEQKFSHTKHGRRHSLC